MSVNILFIGDIVGKPGRKTVRELLPSLMDRFKVDLVVANGENASGGIGISIKGADELLSGGIHVLTSGNHIWKKKEIQTYIQQNPDLIRPANYPGRNAREWVCDQRDQIGTPDRHSQFVGADLYGSGGLPFSKGLGRTIPND